MNNLLLSCLPMRGEGTFIILERNAKDRDNNSAISDVAVPFYVIFVFSFTSLSRLF